MTKKEQQFQDTVWEFYRHHKRAGLLWRLTTDPYKIVVSEIMLQQTQVSRVLPKYEAFIKRWPTVQKLAKAPLGDVLRAWQGLGYNRRAKMLHQCAQKIVEERAGTFPEAYEELKVLPGIGPYTAGAIMAFAYNQPVPIIETNIKTVYIHHFFKSKGTVSDADIRTLVERTMDTENPREWYWALMDYGSYLKSTAGNLNQKAASYTKQSKFKGSDREIRGAILRVLSQQASTKKNLFQALPTHDADRVTTQLKKLVAEQLVIKKGQRYSLPE